QDFLDSQARVLGIATGSQAAAPSHGPTSSSLPPAKPTTASAGTATPPASSVSGSFDAAFPMLGPVIEQTPGRLVIERRYELARDLFLRDHTLGNAPNAADP
ncbi:UNVERIFIED_CONTAM: hypothetical protein IGO34_26935, partial [Salmonella enterica subsp. enterica serovar Weltevreden]